MLEQEPDSLPRGLVRIHLVITRAVDVARRCSRAYANGDEPADSPAAAGLADYLQALVSVLHAHHLGEDEISFPALRDRFPGAPWERLAEEHRAVVPVLAEIEGALAGIRQGPVAAFERLTVTLDRLAALWDPHHRREEEHFSTSALAPLVPQAEQVDLAARMSAHAKEHVGPDYLVLPFLLYNLEGEERRAMSALFPPIVTEQLVPVVWQGQWSAMKPFLLA